MAKITQAAEVDDQNKNQKQQQQQKTEKMVLEIKIHC